MPADPAEVCSSSSASGSASAHQRFLSGPILASPAHSISSGPNAAT
jgi:hypothetical protein